MNADFAANLMIRVLGDDPAAYQGSVTKWATAAALLTDLLVPIIIGFSFFIPFLVIWFWKKKFTPLYLVIAFIIGLMLAYGVYRLNAWSYGYGLGVIFYEINK